MCTKRHKTPSFHFFIECGKSRTTNWNLYVRRKHTLCVECYNLLKITSAGYVIVKGLCIWSISDEIDVNESDYDVKFPSCFIQYIPSNIPRELHNCLDDEGIYEV